jgi:Holliday junction DNA helicase, RuvA subunit
MITQLCGTLLEKNPPLIVLNVNGVGYEVLVSMNTFYLLPDVNEPLTLLTQFVVREDAQTLYGFINAAERYAFRMLTKVSGIGARTALAVLSGLSTEELAQAIAAQEVGRLTRVPGIGKKTAERILLEMKGKLDAVAPIVGAPGSVRNETDDIVNALLALGYNEREANIAVRDLPADIDVAAGIRQALRHLSKA